MTSGFMRLRGHTFLDRFDGSSVIVDAGAHRGGFSRRFCSRFPYAKAILLEANPSLLEPLGEAMSGLRNVEILHAALGGSSGKARFYVNNRLDEGSSLIKELSTISDFRYEDGKVKPVIEPGEGTAVRVRMLSLQGLFKECGIREIDLLKLDIEGAEWDLLGRFQARDSRRVHQVSVEFRDFLNPSYRPRTEACIERMKGLGYSVTCRAEESWGHGAPHADCLFFKG